MLLSPVFPHVSDGKVEIWLSELEQQMKLSVQKMIADALKDYPSDSKGPDPQRTSGGLSFKKYHSDFADWLNKWQSQVLIVV